MDNTIKSLIARVWKNKALQLDAGEHYFDETLTSWCVTRSACCNRLSPRPHSSAHSEWPWGRVRRNEKWPSSIPCAEATR